MKSKNQADKGLRQVSSVRLDKDIQHFYNQGLLEAVTSQLRRVNETHERDYRCKYCLDTGTALLVRTLTNCVWKECYCNATCDSISLDKLIEIEEQSIERYKDKERRLNGLV